MKSRQSTLIEAFVLLALAWAFVACAAAMTWRAIMGYRESAKAQLRADEGVRESAYTDSLGYLTIGVGRLIDARVGGKLWPDEIDYLSTQDDVIIDTQNGVDIVTNQPSQNFSEPNP